MQTKIILFQYLVPLVYTLLYYFLWVLTGKATLFSTVFFLAGFYLGNLLLWADGKFLYSYYNELQTEPKQLITRSIVFLLVYIVLALFVITSSGNAIGIGMIFGIGLTLLAELYVSAADPVSFNHKFLFQLTRPFDHTEIERLVLIFAVALLGISLLFFF